MNRIWVVGVGWTEDALTLGAIRRLREANRVLLRTERLGCAQWLRREGIAYEALDGLYAAAEDFDALNDAAAAAVLDAGGGVVYAVADLADQSVFRLVAQAADRLAFVPGPAAEGQLAAFSGGDMRMLSASNIGSLEPDAEVATLVTEIDSRVLASEVKLRLMDAYPDESAVLLLNEEGAPTAIRLCELDRQARYGHRVSALIPAISELTRMERYGFRQLNRIMRILRAPDGCPWDREQTHASIAANAVEEAYEVVDAIERGDVQDLCEELGDLLLQVTLHAEIARQHGEFGLSDITTGVCAKLIGRHPHIFAGARADTADQVLTMWQQVKKKEKRQTTDAEAMRAIAKSLPAAMRAQKALKRAEACGLPAQFPNAPDAARLREGDEEGAGELLLWAVDVARRAGVQPELALSSAIDRLIDQFERAEQGHKDRD
ncbi:MAG: MazG family protein [Clostridiales bacterium]|nr:MazG family protein [Clostridiales bacterium]